MSIVPWELTRDEFVSSRFSTGYIMINYVIAKKTRRNGGKYELWYRGTRNKVELTYDELYDSPKQAKLDYMLRYHKQAVKEAVARGEPVPKKVLVCYPTLKGEN